MRFVHIADMHFDMQFKMLSDKIGIGEQRRYDQRVILRKIINYIKENNINKIGFSLATLATAPKTLDFPTFFCCWRVAAIAGNVTLKPCVAGILMGTYENQKS